MCVQVGDRFRSLARPGSRTTYSRGTIREVHRAPGGVPEFGAAPQGDGPVYAAVTGTLVEMDWDPWEAYTIEWDSREGFGGARVKVRGL